MDILEALSWRYASKKFLPQKISDTDLQQLLEVARLAPTAYWLQPFKIIVIEDKKIREQLKNHSQNQTQITDASHVLVFSIIKDLPESYLDDYMKLVAETRNIPIEALTSYKNMVIASINSNGPVNNRATNQAYIVLWFLLLAAAQMKIDVCPIEMFDIEAYNKILNLDQQWLSAVVMCAVWYRDPDDQNANFKKIRRPYDDIISYYTSK